MLLGDTLNDRIKRELFAHTSSDVLSKSYRLKNLFPHILQYPSKKAINTIVDQYLKPVKSSKILDYGCGHGQSSLALLDRGANVVGIDISPVYISDATQAAKQKGYLKNQFLFQVMDAHRLKFENNTFDMVIGKGILHHLNINVALKEVHRVLKTGGRALMLEPLADNPLLKLFRLLTPFARTADERPLSKNDLINIAESYRWNPELTYCGIIEAFTAMFTSVFTPKSPDNWLLTCADHLETFFHEHDLLPSWNQYVLFNLVKK